MISIVIPLYNKGTFIKRTLESVFAQTYQDFEIVIVDDGSTDNSVEVVESIEDDRIRLIRQKNSGVSAARNRGIAEAKGELIAFIDADDEWMPEFLQTMVCLTEKYPECDVFAVNYEMHTNDGKIISTIINNLPFDTEDGILTNYFEVASCSNPPICSISIMAKKEVFNEIGGFPLGIKSGEDLLTWARMACRFKIAYSKVSLAIFNIDGYSIKEKPKRIPADDDIVSDVLVKLYRQYKPKAMKKYISLWHKMRCNIYFRLGMRLKSINEAFKGIKFNPFNYKLYAYIVLNILPMSNSSNR